MSAPTRAPHPALAAWTALHEQAAGRGALVSLVQVEGGGSKPVGAHLALAEDGRAFGSVTIGGCADGRALVAAQRVLHSGTRELITVPLSEEDALALGLGCAGDVELLVERVGFGERDPLADAMTAARSALERGIRGVLVTPLGIDDGRLLVCEDGTRAGAMGSGEREAAAAELAAAALRQGDVASGVREANGDRWLLQLLAPIRTLLIVGATDVAAVLCTIAASLGWRAVLIDPRDDLLAEPRFAAAAERHAALPAEAVAQRIGSASTAVVVVAHDYKVELPVLRVALPSRTPYVGMLGSRRRGTTIRAMLAEDGVGAAELARLRTPIGLPIGANGAGEIAISIAAELIACWGGASIGVSAGGAVPAA